ncbi:MAG: hypothetical protein ACYC2H_12990 [Thermoplasmatota archaeon]
MAARAALAGEPVVFRAEGYQVWLPVGGAVVCAGMAALGWAGGVTFPATLLTLVSVIAGGAAVHVARWRLIVDDVGVSVGGLLAEPPLEWPEIAAVHIEERMTRSPMRLRFVPRSGSSSTYVAFPLRRLAEADRHRLFAELTARGYQVQVGTLGW